MTNPSKAPSPTILLGLLIATSTLLTTGCASQPKPQAELDRKYSFWPSAPNEPHIQFLVAFNSSTDIAPQRTGFDAMVYGKEDAQSVGVNKPYGVRMWNGCVYVCDVRGSGVMVLDLRKKQTRMMGVSGSGTIRKAVDLAISPDGFKYVADQGQQAVLVFDPAERFVKMFPIPESSPVGITVFRERIYVTDFKNADVKILDRTTGRQIGMLGSRGGEDGQFIGPLSVACDADGNVYVSDTMRARVQKFSPDGKFLLGFGEPGDRPGNFIRPKQMSIGSDGYLHVVDAAFNNVQVFDPEGQVVGYYGSSGAHAGAMDLPAGIDVHEADFDIFEKFVHPAFQVERLILVSNQFGSQKIAVYAMGHLKPGKRVEDIAAARGEVATGLGTTTQPATTQASEPAPAGSKTEPKP